MARFDLWKSLSNGRLSSLPPGLRLLLARVAAKLRGADGGGRAFLEVSDRLTAIENDLVQEIQITVERLRRELEETCRGVLSNTLFAPVPVDSEMSRRRDLDELIKEKEFHLIQRPAGSDRQVLDLSHADGVEELYDYFLSVAKVQDPKDLIGLVARDSIQQATSLSFETAVSSDPRFEIAPESEVGEDDTKVEAEHEISSPEEVVADLDLDRSMDDDADRRQFAYDMFALTTAPVFQRLRQDCDATKDIAAASIAQSSNKALELIGAAVPRGDIKSDDELVELLAARSYGHVLDAVNDQHKSIDQVIGRIDQTELATSILTERLNDIDEKFGKPYRKEFMSRRKAYQSWTEVRNALDRKTNIELVTLSADVIRNELRRELIAGSVQCFISPRGEKLMRYSTREASGPPPYFMSWIESPTASLRRWLGKLNRTINRSK